MIQRLPLYHSPAVLPPPVVPLWLYVHRCTDTHFVSLGFTHSPPNLPGTQLVLEQSSWVVGGY